MCRASHRQNAHDALGNRHFVRFSMLAPTLITGVFWLTLGSGYIATAQQHPLDIRPQDTAVSKPTGSPLVEVMSPQTTPGDRSALATQPEP